MELLLYVIGVVFRILITPLVLVFCLIQWLRATANGKVLEVKISERDFISTGGSNNSPGSAGVDDTLAAFRAKAGQLGKVKRAGDFGS